MDSDERIRKPFLGPYSGLLKLTQAHSSQGLAQPRTLVGVGWKGVQ